ncbi:MAG: HEAT repeat domain-containing protein [Deltaproteobacteria bacterium]|nr:HEAT repeat domain-containing protein [Deltaproteobacteria bacterium]
MRQRAIWALWRYGGPGVLDAKALTRALGDPDPMVRYFANAALERLGS